MRCAGIQSLRHSTAFSTSHYMDVAAVYKNGPVIASTEFGLSRRLACPEMRAASFARLVHSGGFEIRDLSGQLGRQVAFRLTQYCCLPHGRAYQGRSAYCFSSHPTGWALTPPPAFYRRKCRDRKSPAIQGNYPPFPLTIRSTVESCRIHRTKGLERPTVCFWHADCDDACKSFLHSYLRQVFRHVNHGMLR